VEVRVGKIGISAATCPCGWDGRVVRWIVECAFGSDGKEVFFSTGLGMFRVGARLGMRDTAGDLVAGDVQTMVKGGREQA
jgi:hypothetical protein